MKGRPKLTLDTKTLGGKDSRPASQGEAEKEQNPSSGVTAPAHYTHLPGYPWRKEVHREAG